MSLRIHHRIPRQDVGLGLVFVEGIEAKPAPEALTVELDRWISLRREHSLAPAEEAVRQGGRDILRNGSYRPTGRGKPASEYLLRAAGDGTFPRINGPVDANNLVSLKYCVAISLWDVDLTGVEEFEFRLGSAKEHYIFNPAGQVLELKELICGCGMTDQGRSSPMVTPIKDSLATKIQGGTRRVAGCIYYPLKAGDRGHLEEITQEFLRWLLLCGDGARGLSRVLLQGEQGVL